MIVPSKTVLRKEVLRVLKRQGYTTAKGKFTLKETDRDSKRDAHRIAKAERIVQQEEFIKKNLKLVREHFINDRKLELDKIKPRLIEVKAGSKWEKIFRWWNLVWWSLPNEQPYGRQLRFVVWDEYHKSPIGLIGLQSPILSWSVRDTFLGIPAAKRDFWANQSLSAQRLGSIPPYNYLRGGKLVASLMTSEGIRKKFAEKYAGKKTLIKKRVLPARLLFLTTTGAFGKSSVYSRLKFKDDEVARFIGYSKGMGSFHIPNDLYEHLMKFLKRKKIEVERGFGNGPSRKMRLILQALEMLDIPNGTTHGIERAVYLFPLASNLKEVIQKGARPKWYKRQVGDLTAFWRERWARSQLDKEPYLEALKTNMLDSTLADLKEYKKLVKKMKQ